MNTLWPYYVDSTHCFVRGVCVQCTPSTCGEGTVYRQQAASADVKLEVLKEWGCCESKHETFVIIAFNTRLLSSCGVESS
jgi:hypothetical protein